MTDKPSDISDSIEATEDAQDLDAALAELAEAQGDIDIDTSELSLDDLESQVESLLSEIVVPAEDDDALEDSVANAQSESVAAFADDAIDLDSTAGTAQSEIEPQAEHETIPEVPDDDHALAAAIEDAAHAADLTDTAPTPPDAIDPAATEASAAATDSADPLATAPHAEDLPSLDAQLAEMTETMLAEPAIDSTPAESEFAASVAEASSQTPPPPGHTESPEPPKPVATAPEPKHRGSIGGHVQRVAYTLLNPLSKPLEKASQETRHTVGWVGVVTLFMGAVMWAVVLTRAPKEADAAAPFDLANASLPAVHAGGSTPLPSEHAEAPKKDSSHGGAKSSSHATKKSKAPPKKKEAAGGH